MAVSELVYEAARCNADWCDAFCRTYAIAGRFDTECWTSPQRTPPFYPDAVTLVPRVAPERLLSHVDPGDGCSVKDSFADLDLTEDGFQVLFRGEWLFRERADAVASSGRWLVIEMREQLREWEAAWGESREEADFFRPALLANAAVAVLARYDGDRIGAGAIANRGATVIGLSNVFDLEGDRASVWSDAAGAAQRRWGVMPVVSYDSGTALRPAHRAGFESIGELAVWVKPFVATHSGEPTEPSDDHTG